MDSDFADPARSCTRKKGYPSEGVARLAIASIRRVSPEAELRTYGCRHCGLWHVGGVPRGDRVGALPFDDEDPDERLDRARRRRGKPGRERRRAYGSGYIRRPSRQRDREDRRELEA